ncbi:MAG: hypothetical protein IKQ91_05360 [Oscillospiraceae bacterium]|nr:hypothetical protein [Oscillospiraceae bacterium]
MNYVRPIRAAALMLLTAALLSGCGTQNPDSTADTAENLAVQTAAPESSSDAPASETDAGTDPTIAVASITAKAGDRKVPVNIEFRNNPGYCGGGLQIGYDPALTPYTTGIEPGMEIPDAEYKPGPAADGFLTSCMVGEQVHLIAFGCMGTEDNTSSGTIFTCYVDVPEDAESGTQYKFTVNIDSLTSSESSKIDCKTEDGILTVE